MESLPAYCSIYEKKNRKGITLAVLVQPRSSKVGPLGEFGESKEWLKWGIAAAPVDGQANRALIEQIATWFKVTKSQVVLLKGESSRKKIVLIEGVGLELLGRFLRSFTRAAD